MSEAGGDGGGARDGARVGCGLGQREELPNPDIFSWIRVAYIDSFSEYPGPYPGTMQTGHGSKGETMLIMASLPQSVRMELLDTLDTLPNWLENSHEAEAEVGRRWLEFCVDGWVRELEQGR